MSKKDFFLKNGIIVEGRRYLPHTVQTEDELERLVVANSEALFPHAYIFAIKFSAKDAVGTKTHADMCLVSHDCKSWWIIEVERCQGEYYSREKIAPQIALQREANWMTKVDQVIREICKKGAKKQDAESLRQIKPQFILLTDNHDDLIKKMARNYGFKQIILFPMRDEMGRFCLLPLLQEVNPDAPDNSILRIDQKDVDLFNNKLHIPIDSTLISKYKNQDQVILVIDKEYHNLNIQATGKVSIPIKQDSKAQSRRLSFETLPYVFEIDTEGDVLLLEFKEEKKRW